MLNIVVLGAPCSGKGTQSLRIASFFNLSHISTGELFREEIKNKSKIGLIAQAYIDKGQLVPDAIVLKEIYKNASRKINREGFVFDGFPRTLNQAMILDKSFEKKRMQISLVVYINVSEDELVSRMLHRSKGSDRSDDCLDILKTRVSIYKEQTMPLLSYYEKQNKLVKVSGMNSIEEVFSKIRVLIEEHLKK